jgi:hypothetical protein
MTFYFCVHVGCGAYTKPLPSNALSKSFTISSVSIQMDFHACKNLLQSFSCQKQVKIATIFYQRCITQTYISPWKHLHMLKFRVDERHLEEEFRLKCSVSPSELHTSNNGQPFKLCVPLKLQFLPG